MADLTLTRKELYDLVWAHPLLFLSKKYDVSDVGLRKICKRMQVPVPNNGHWARFPANRVAPLKLPPKYSGKGTVEFKLRGKEDNSEKMALKERVEEFRTNRSIRIFEKLTDPDDLVVASKKLLNLKDGRSHRYKGMVTSELTGLDICVLPENVERALCFMDAIIKTLRARGHDISLRHQETYAVIFDQEIKITFRDKLKREIIESGSYPRTELVSTGSVCFKARINYNDKEWKDDAETIEQQLPMIMARLELEGQRKADQAAFHQRQRKKQELKDKRERAVKEKQEKELRLFKKMLDQSVRWRKAKDLREYIDAREKHAIDNDQLTDDLRRWVAWARQKADWYDPFIESKDKLLKDIEKDSPDLPKTEPLPENNTFLPYKNWFQKSFYHKK